MNNSRFFPAYLHVLMFSGEMHFKQKLCKNSQQGETKENLFFPALTNLNGMPSVLYVDDEPELLTLCRLFLEKDGKNTVETAESAEEGLKKLRAGHFNVIISDYLMPESDGVEFLKQVRAEFGDIPFILFTGKGREEVVIEAINLGVTFYLQKGSDPASRFSELNRKIETAIRRSRAEETCREKTGELDQFFTLALDLLCIADTDGYFRRLNPAWEMILGWRIDELEGKKFLDLVHPDDMTTTLNAMEDLRTGKKIVNFINRFRCKDGVYRWIEWRAFPYWEKLMYAAARDITERKQVEQALQLANKKLNLMAEITRHDIRNKLTVLGGYLSLLKEYPPRSQASMYVDKLMETTTIIAQHIEFTRLYQNLGVVPPSWQNVQTVFLRACTHVELHQVQIRSDLENVEIFADPLLERVFYNQIDNSLRYGGPKKTYISLAAYETRDGLIITIEDDGVGIPPQDKEKIFRRGFGKNTGLGLFLAREILSITGISLSETGEYLQGARFELVVPKGTYRYSSP
jgi:PAS domain S-box-containing protein